jgi:predicted lipoprotein
MKKIKLFIGLLSILIACDSDSETETTSTNIDDNFNRELLLENWADNIIVPSYQNLVSSLDLLHTATDEFIQTPDQSNLTILRTAWSEAYIAWQSVEMFEIGKAEEITLRNYMNVFPLDEVSMQASLLAGNYDLSLVNRQDEQGFSALDFLLYGLANTDDGILSHYTDTENGSNYKTYLSDVVVRMKDLSTSVLDDWNNSFRDTFVANNGSSATASVNSMVNDYMFYYEKYLRAGKIGIPAGVFSGSPLIEKVEARFRADLSKTLFMSALEASQNFFNGVHFNGQASRS